MAQKHKPIKYDSFYYKLGVKKSNDNLGYFTPLVEKFIPVGKIDGVKQHFLDKSETISKIGCNIIYYHKYCRKWEEGDKTFLEYITGFVSDNQD